MDHLPLYRIRFWDWTDWVLLKVTNDPDGEGDTDDDTIERLQAVLDTALGSAPSMRVQRLGEDGDWEDVG